MEILTELYCVVDDFCQAFLPEFESHLLAEHTSTYHRPCRLSSAEIMTLLIYFHQSGYRNFKQYYTEYVALYLKKDFPHLLSYNRFVELISETPRFRRSLPLTPMWGPSLQWHYSADLLQFGHPMALIG